MSDIKKEHKKKIVAPARKWGTVQKSTTRPREPTFGVWKMENVITIIKDKKMSARKPELCFIQVTTWIWIFKFISQICIKEGHRTRAAYVPRSPVLHGLQLGYPQHLHIKREDRTPDILKLETR